MEDEPVIQDEPITPSGTSYATVEELEAYWRPLTEAEQARANTLIAIASARLRVYASRKGVALDDKFDDDEDYAATVKWVVMEAVKRAIATPVDTPPVDNYSQSAGPYSENYRFTNPSGDLWFKKSELLSIGLAGLQTLNSITPTTRRDIYGEQSL